MSDWFCVSAWYENGETEIHYEIANEDGEQYFFWLSVKGVLWPQKYISRPSKEHEIRRQDNQKHK